MKVSSIKDTRLYQNKQFVPSPVLEKNSEGLFEILAYQGLYQISYGQKLNSHDNPECRLSDKEFRRIALKAGMAEFTNRHATLVCVHFNHSVHRMHKKLSGIVGDIWTTQDVSWLYRTKNLATLNCNTFKSISILLREDLLFHS
jgi:hypothetical protein